MNNELRFYRKFSLCLLAALIVSFIMNIYQYNQQANVKETVKVVTKVVTKWKEHTTVKPEAVADKPVATVAVPISPTDSDNEDSECGQDSTLHLKGDSVLIPITQKVYEDSLYTAYVSGYRPCLDSITVRERITTQYVYETRTRVKKNRIGVGLVGGYGYGFKSKEFEPFVGVGINVNIFSW